MIIIMYVIAGLKSSLIIKKARFIIYFSIFIFFIQALSSSQGIVLFTLIPASSPIFPSAIPITSSGILLGLSMMLRFLGIVLSSLLFVSVTDPNKLANSLIRIGLPYRYGFMIVTSLRFIPLFELEANTVRKAQLSRGIKLKTRGLTGIYDHIKYTLRPLIVTAIQKAETLSRSMEGRGFGVYKKRTFINQTPITTKDKAIGIGAIIVTIIILISFTIYYNQYELADYLVSRINLYFK